MGQLVIVGTVAFDEVETPFGESGKILGGAGTYIALAANHFKADSAIVSVIGEDFPQDYIDIFKNRDIDTDGLETVNGGKSFYWKGRYHDNMNNRDTLETQLNVLENFEPKVPGAYKDAGVVMLGNLHPEVQMSVINQMNSPQLVVLDTMNFWMDSTLESLKQVIAKVDVITINDEEARQLSGEYSLVKANREIQKMGPKTVVIKKGEHGALLFQGEDSFFAPALPLEETFDPTGAGDTFAGGFAGYLASTRDYSFDNMKRATIYASNLASFCVESFGTQRLQNLTKDEVRNRLKQFKKLSQFQIDLE